MWLIKSLISNVVISAFLLYVFDYYHLWIEIEFVKLRDLWFNNEVVNVIWVFLILWLIFWVFNSPVKRILKLLSCPINFLTMWLVSLALNVIVFYLFAVASNLFFNWEISVTLWNLVQTLILSFIMALWTSILKKII